MVPLSSLLDAGERGEPMLVNRKLALE